MIFREALPADIPALHYVRMAVKENVLNTPSLVTTEDYRGFLTTNGKGWLCETVQGVIGFAIVDITQRNIWALFVHPLAEGKGIGKQLQALMLDWYFDSLKEALWLTTAAGTRAERFYTSTGWRNAGLQANGEVRFEMSYEQWVESKNATEESAA